LAADRAALDRALAVVAEESFFTMVDPVSDAPGVDGPMLAARVAFEGSFSGTLCCRMSRALARELTAAFTGEILDQVADGPAVDDLAGEFANMVCGRWLSEVAPQCLFRLGHPSVAAPGSPEGAPTAPAGLLNGQPIWIELTIDARGAGASAAADA
jgi:hypothetical protein